MLWTSPAAYEDDYAAVMHSRPGQQLIAIVGPLLAGTRVGLDAVSRAQTAAPKLMRFQSMVGHDALLAQFQRQYFDDVAEQRRHERQLQGQRQHAAVQVFKQKRSAQPVSYTHQTQQTILHV